MSELLIRSLSKYTTLTPDEAAMVTSLFTGRRFRKRQYILQEGEPMRFETFILRGLTRTYEVDERGQGACRAVRA